MAERWVNAVVKVTIPLDVSVDASQGEKLAASAALTDHFDWPDDAVITCNVETVEDGEPLEPTPKTRLDSLIKGLEEEANRLRQSWTAAEQQAGRRLSQLIEEHRNG
jgi:hypothetical protein